MLDSLPVQSFLDNMKQLIQKKWKYSYSSKLILKVICWITFLNAVKLVRVIKFGFFLSLVAFRYLQVAVFRNSYMKLVSIAAVGHIVFTFPGVFFFSTSLEKVHIIVKVYG